MKLKSKNMDSVTYNKLEYITSGSGLTQNELNEIVDLMDEYAREHVTEALRKHGVMQAEGSDVSEGAAVASGAVGSQTGARTCATGCDWPNCTLDGCVDPKCDC
jgi:hypothetical protein